MNKRVSIGEIRWMLRSINQGAQANDLIKKNLPEEIANIYAPMKIGKGFYQWSLPDLPLQPQSAANDTDKVAIQQKLNKLYDTVTEHFKDPHTAQALLATPDEDYVMFAYDDEGNIQLCITGWGFAPTKPTGGFYIYKKTEPIPDDVDPHVDKGKVTPPVEDGHEDEDEDTDKDGNSGDTGDDAGESVEEPRPNVSVTFITHEGKPLTGVEVSFSFANGNSTNRFMLSDDGTCSFGRDLCPTDVEAKAHIHFEQQLDIPFTINKDEDNYILSEIREEESPKNLVLEIIMGVLLAGALVAIGYFASTF